MGFSYGALLKKRVYCFDIFVYSMCLSCEWAFRSVCQNNHVFTPRATEVVFALVAFVAFCVQSELPFFLFFLL